MPRGWYLAQGLIPLGYHSGDDEEGPCELPNGRLVCGPHGQVICGRCCTDYSFQDGNDSDGDYDEESEASDPILSDPAPARDDSNPLSIGPRLTKGTGRCFPTKFIPPT